MYPAPPRSLSLRDAFTLVEILIVVVILGILAAVVAPQFTQATGSAQAEATLNELQKLRRHVSYYRTRNSGALPPVVDMSSVWTGIVPDTLGQTPVNAWVGGANARVIRVVANAVPDTAFHTNYGWIFDSVTGDVFAASFDADDNPLARP